jgi:serine/threonine protein kinase
LYVKDNQIIDEEEVEIKTLQQITNNDQELESFLRCLLTVDPNFRPSAEEALSHSYMSSL